MTRRTTRSDNPSPLASPLDPSDGSGGGDLWIGEHIGDHDILVLDPAETDPTADVLTLYSLTQHRVRRFRRATVAEQIQGLADRRAHQRAEKEYAQRVALRDGHEQALETAHAERMDRIREGMIAAHQRHIASLGLEYQGVHSTDADTKIRASKCHVCDTALDDFVGVTCGICSRVLCSCGACACGKPAHGRRATAKARPELQGEA